MNRIKLLALTVFALVVMGGVASASIGITGRWAGTAFANSEFDMNGDGISARQFSMTAYAGPIAGFEGIFDTALLSIGVCAPGALELQAFGTMTFRNQVGDGLFAEVPPDAPHLCFDPANPSEVVQIVITGGTGAYAGATGTGTLTLHDTVRAIKLVTLPGFGTVPAPTLIDSIGEFVLNVQ